jgi:hypothetical protein
MKKTFALKLCVLVSLSLFEIMPAIAQIPYFAGTVGDGLLYGYSSVKARPGINRQETYVWGNDYLKSHPRVIVGIDFAL